MAAQTVSHEDVRASKVTRSNVYNREGDHLGSVEDVIIGKRDGQVKCAIMSFGGILGIGEGFHPMAWAEGDYSENRSGFVVNCSREKLEGAPQFSMATEPNWMDRAYGKGVYGYYGVPMSEARKRGMQRRPLSRSTERVAAAPPKPAPEPFPGPGPTPPHPMPSPPPPSPIPPQPMI